MRERLAVLPGIFSVLIISIVVIGGIFAGLWDIELLWFGVSCSSLLRSCS